MAEREPDEGGLRGLVDGGGNGHAPAAAPSEVEAYEQDWYRSLKALAERARELEEAEAGPDAVEPAAPRPREPDDGGSAARAAETDAVEPAAGTARERTEPVGPDGWEADMGDQRRPFPDRGAAPVGIPGPEAPPAGTSVADAPSPQLPGSRAPSLTSSDAAERRAALEELAVRGVSDADLGRVAALVVDPDRDVRRLALEILTPRAADVSLEVIRQALQDPADEVRAAAVRLAAARPVSPAEVAPLIGARRSPLVRTAALEALPRLVRGAGWVDDEALDVLLWAVADLASPGSEDERAVLGELGRLLGPSRLAEALGHGDARRLGALRMLAAEGSAEALAAAAALRDDPDEAVRALAAAALDRLAELEPPPPAEREPERPASEPPGGDGVVPGPARASEERPTSVGSSGSAPSPAARVVGGADGSAPPAGVVGGADGSAPVVATPDAAAPSPAAGPPEGPSASAPPAESPGSPVPTAAVVDAERGSTGDPVEAVAARLAGSDAAARQEARERLGALDRAALVEWTREALRGDDPGRAGLAAALAEAAGLVEVAHDLIERGLGLSGEARRAFGRALQALVSTRSGELEGVLGRIAPERRPEAVRLLWEAAGAAAMPLLRSALVDPTPAVRIAVLEVLRGTAEPGAMEAATTALTADSAPAVREAAVRLLADAPPAHRIAPLTRALLDPDPAVRTTAVELLAAGGGRDAAAPLLRALSDPDEGVRRAAVRHVAALPDEDLPLVWSALLTASPEHREQIVAVMERTAPDRLARLAIERVAAPEPEQRLLAVELLGRAGGPEALGAAIQALQDVRAEVRRAATAALAALRSPEAVPALGRSLGDPDPQVRAGAVRALGVIDDEAVLGFLVTALKDPDPDVRGTASEVLTEWSSPAVAKRLAEVLEHPELRGQARELLVRMGPSAVELLVDVLLQASPAVRPEIGDLLERIAGRDRFEERLSSIDPHQRLRALQALAAMGGGDLVPALLRALSDPDERIRILAVDLLAEAGDPAAVEPLRRTFLSDPVPEVVRAAERALARLRPEA